MEVFGVIRKALVFASVAVFCVLLASAAFADIKLTEPKKEGGDGIFTLLERRASGARDNFPKGPVTLDELSAILWAATGRNRGNTGWTVPLAGGLPPYVAIYAVKSDGVFLYDPGEHALKEISDKNALSSITGDGFVRDSPVVLVFVSDPGGLGDMSRLNEGNALAYTASGAMSQNAYLAADSLGISARYMASMKADVVRSELKLREEQTPLCIMPLGKR
jgi:nitroreductase